MRALFSFLALLVLCCAAPPAATAADGGPGPGKPIWPRKGQLDKHLWTKAMSIQSRMWEHLSPEGLLVVRHRRGASPADLSHDALDMPDAAMWTGCYAASQACRWAVTRDPDALAQVRHLAKGMVALQEVTGVRGRFARNVGVPQTANPGEKSQASPTGSGYWMRDDTSRDQLVGMTLGWYFIGRFMEDPHLRATAARQLGDIARRLYTDGMWMRDSRGGKTKHGELRQDVQFLPMIQNGTLASIGYATVVAAAHLNPQDTYLQEIVSHLSREEWDEAVANQFTFFRGRVTSPNVNMCVISLMVLSMTPNARTKLGRWIGKGMRALRKATVGWWNAGFCSCFLMAGAMPEQTRFLLGETRATLHGMPEREEPRILLQNYRGRSPAPIWQRQPSSWYWTNDVAWFHIWKPDPEGTLGGVYWTGADYLFAYWIARKADQLIPVVGPGKEPHLHPCAMSYPRWMPNGVYPETPPPTAAPR